MLEVDNDGVKTLLVELYGEYSVSAALKHGAALVDKGLYKEAARFARLAAELAERHCNGSGSGV